MNYNKKIRAIALLSIAAFMSACASTTPPVIDKLDENTGVTITYSRTPFVFSPNEEADDYSAVEFVQVGMIEVNTMGTLRYYLWMGVSEPRFSETAGRIPERFAFVDFDIDGRQFRLDAVGSSHEAIGTSETPFTRAFTSLPRTSISTSSWSKSACSWTRRRSAFATRIRCRASIDPGTKPWRHLRISRNSTAPFCNSSPLGNGADRVTRTPDPRITNPLRILLITASYVRSS